MRICLDFADTQHIARYFRAEKGMSPLAYRKAYGTPGLLVGNRKMVILFRKVALFPCSSKDRFGQRYSKDSKNDYFLQTTFKSVYAD